MRLQLLPEALEIFPFFREGGIRHVTGYPIPLDVNSDLLAQGNAEDFLITEVLALFCLLARSYRDRRLLIFLELF
jgi:hypothetical protein